MRTLACLLLPCLAASLGAAAPPVADTAALVRRLGAASFEERERAERLLSSLGKASLPALREGAKGREAEVRHRCVRLLARLERAAIEPRLAALVEGQDTFAPPLPGWATFREVVGRDAPARALYVDIFAADRVLLEWVQAGSGGASARLRAENLWARTTPARGNAREAPPVGRYAGVVLLATLAKGDERLDATAVNRLLGKRAAVGHVASDPAFRRLVGQFFARQGVRPELLNQSAYLTRFLGLEGVRNDVLKPAALRALESVLTPTPDLGRLTEAAVAVEILEVQDRVPERTRKAVRSLAERVAARPFEYHETQMVLSILTCLQMRDSAKVVFEPGALKLARGLTKSKADTGRLNEVYQLCQGIESSEGVEAVELAACAMLADRTCDGATPEAIAEAIEITQLIQLDEAREGLLVPALRKRLLAALERPDDFEQLDRCVELSVRANWEGAGELVKPVLRRRVDALAGDPTAFERFTRLYQLARRIRADDVIEEHIRPALGKSLAAAGTRGLGATAELQGLTLALDLRLKEGVPLALRVALGGKGNGRGRANAVGVVAMLGTPAQIERLAPLLGDATAVGASNRGGETRHSEVRDVVLAALVVGTRQSLLDYNFAKGATFSTRRRMIFVTQFGFRTDDERKAALARWQKWDAARKK